MPAMPSSDPATTAASRAWLAGLGLPVASVNDRQAGLPAPLRQVHRRLLAHVAAHGGPPDPATVGAMAAEQGLDLNEALGHLAEADLVHTDPATGRIMVAYPFSGRPTAHRVTLAAGPTVWAMCAVDALGIPQMTGRDGKVSSADSTSGQPVTVEVRGGDWRWQPATTVVLVATTTGAGSCGAVADCCCPYINFHTDPDHARRYLEAHPGLSGELLSQAHAVEVAGWIFGRLLAPDAATSSGDLQAAADGLDERR